MEFVGNRVLSTHTYTYSEIIANGQNTSHLVRVFFETNGWVFFMHRKINAHDVNMVNVYVCVCIFGYIYITWGLYCIRLNANDKTVSCFGVFQVEIHFTLLLHSHIDFDEEK